VEIYLCLVHADAHDKQSLMSNLRL